MILTGSLLRIVRDVGLRPRRCGHGIAGSEAREVDPAAASVALIKESTRNLESELHH
jgi:hypothetical protein